MELVIAQANCKRSDETVGIEKKEKENYDYVGFSKYERWQLLFYSLIFRTALRDNTHVK